MKKKNSKTTKAPRGRVARRRPRMRTGYVCECGVCGNGLVRYWMYRGCVVGMCDDCELVWSDLAALAKKNTTKAEGSFPGGPDEKGKEGDWKLATHRDVDRADFDGTVAGYSE